MKTLITGITLLVLAAVAVALASQTELTNRQVRDPHKLEDWLELNATTKAVTELTATNLTITSAHYGWIVLCNTNAAIAITLPANGAAAGSWVDFLVVGNDSCAPTITAATVDTLKTFNDNAADSVTYGTGHRMGAYLRLISDGTYWNAINLGSGTMTVGT